MSRHTLNTLELIDMAIADLTELRHRVLWLQGQQDGRRRTGGPGPVTTSAVSDPTSTAVVGHVHDRPNDLADSSRSLHQVISGKLHATHRDMLWLVNDKTPGWLDRLELADDEPRPSDANEGTGLGPAELDGGVSAYRGDRKIPSTSRVDLLEALDAQHRRLERGEGWGDA
jgi:hypothetical protein